MFPGNYCYNLLLGVSIILLSIIVFGFSFKIYFQLKIIVSILVTFMNTDRNFKGIWSLSETLVYM